MTTPNRATDRTTDRSPDRLAWGVLGTGNIARQFADGVIRSARRGGVVAVGSRSPDSANAFAEPRQIKNVHGSYDALLADPAVDAVYNSLPNSLHHEWTIKALRAGKHVLCEKPFALTASQAQEMFDVARKAGKVLVEAFMYRSHPLTHAVIDSVRGGEIGDLKLIRTSFCYKTARVDGNVRFDKKLGGGGLMDVGCYCINLSRLLAGEEPDEIHASAHLHERGVDDLLVATLSFPGGVLASFTCGMSVHADNTAYLCGSEGFIEIPLPWKPPPEQAAYTVARSTPPRMDLAAAAGAVASTAGAPRAATAATATAAAGTSAAATASAISAIPFGAGIAGASGSSTATAAITPPRPPRETRFVDANSELYALEADDFAAAVLDGKPPAVSQSDTLGNMKVLDEIRRQIGLTF